MNAPSPTPPRLPRPVRRQAAQGQELTRLALEPLTLDLTAAEELRRQSAAHRVHPREFHYTHYSDDELLRLRILLQTGRNLLRPFIAPPNYLSRHHERLGLEVPRVVSPPAPPPDEFTSRSDLFDANQYMPPVNPLLPRDNFIFTEPSGSMTTGLRPPGSLSFILCVVYMGIDDTPAPSSLTSQRSEERRVGKECLE